MGHPFQELRPEYDHLLSIMKITRQREVDAVATKLCRHDIMDHHIAVSKVTGVPAIWYAVTFEREASSNFHLALGQGDPWNRVSVNVPRGQGPFPSWEAAAIFYTRFDHVQVLSIPAWTWAYMCWKDEIYNGFGPRNHGRYSGYLWSGTSVYDPPTGKAGKYVRDGQWSPNTEDHQLGTVPLMLRIAQLRPDLAVGKVPVPGTGVLPPKPVTPEWTGGGAHDTVWIQKALNVLGDGPLAVDGNYGRDTRAAARAFQVSKALIADGLVGPKTDAALVGALAEKGITTL